jgi:hypothetical protein
MSSAAEAELGTLYINACEAIPQRHMLEEMGHPQPPMPIQMDNSIALGAVTNIIQPKHTKATLQNNSKLVSNKLASQIN